MDTYSLINNAWKETCKVLFGKEIGELSEFEQWISEYVKFPAQRKDIHGHDVFVYPEDYPKEARYIRFEELTFKKFEPLTINEIKDIDSIVEAIKDRFVYVGNVVTGNSQAVFNSTNVIESSVIYNSWIVTNSKYVAYSGIIKDCSYIFGTLGDAESDFTIKNIDGHKNRRVFECYSSNTSSDAYYTSRVDNSSEVMFSFGLKGVRYVIGNVQLDKQKYHTIKNSLLSQIADELEKNKRIFSLLEIISEMPDPSIHLELPSEKELRDIKPINDAFNRTARIILGQELGNIDDFKDYLWRHVMKVHRSKSAVSGKELFVPGYLLDNFRVKRDILKRHVTLQESRKIAQLAKAEIEGIKIDKEDIIERLKEIAFLCIEARIGNIKNTFDAVALGHSTNCCIGSAYMYSSFCAYCFWPRESKYIFGSDSVWNSSFSIKAFNSSKVNRVFEVMDALNCSDVYFSYNVENVNDGFFNFNVKNLSYAIGNAEYSKSTYLKIKLSLLEQITSELKRTKNLKWDIYTLAAY